jgi:hypothetical protein
MYQGQGLLYWWWTDLQNYFLWCYKSGTYVFMIMVAHLQMSSFIMRWRLKYVSFFLIGLFTLCVYVYK